MNSLSINSLSYIQQQAFPFIAKQLKLILFVAFVAIALVVSALTLLVAGTAAARYFLGLDKIRLKRAGAAPHNPLGDIRPNPIFPDQSHHMKWETLPVGVAHTIMTFADPSSIANIQQTSKKMNALFQFHRFIESVLFKGSQIERQCYAVDSGDKITVFQKERSAESLMRLGFQAAEEGIQGNLSKSNIEKGLQRISSIYEKLFEQEFRELKEWEDACDGARDLPPARRTARYYLDLMLWSYVTYHGSTQLDGMFLPSREAYNKGELGCRFRLVAHALGNNGFNGTWLNYNFNRKITRGWTLEKKRKWIKVDELLDRTLHDTDYVHLRSSKILVNELVCAYLTTLGKNKFHLETEHKPSFYYENRSTTDFVICGLVAAIFLRHFAFMRSEAYWKMIDQYEQILSEGDEDWSQHCNKLQQKVKVDLNREERTKEIFDIDLQLRLLVRES